MSRIDQLTGARANSANSRSHSNIATRRKQEVNLQSVRIGGTKIRVTARTLKTIKKLRAKAEGKLPSKRQKKAAKTAARKVAPKK